MAIKWRMYCETEAIYKYVIQDTEPTECPDNPTDTIRDIVIIDADDLAIHTDKSSEISSITEKTIPDNADWVLIESSANANAKRKVKVQNFRPLIGEINHAYITDELQHSTTSASWVDVISGQITTDDEGFIFAIASTVNTNNSSGGGTTTEFRIVIDTQSSTGIEHEPYGDLERVVTFSYVTATKLPAGTYDVKLQWRRVNGTSTLYAEDTKLTALSLVGAVGPQGSSINWVGELSSPPTSPSFLDAYYDTTLKQSRIWNGASWNILAESGPAGADGDITWTGDWVSGTYTANQAVSYNGSSYVATTTTTEIPSDTATDWDILASKGDQGIGSSIIVKEGGVNVTNTPHTALNFNDNTFNISDNGDGSATVDTVISDINNIENVDASNPSNKQAILYEPATYKWTAQDLPTSNVVYYYASSEGESSTTSKNPVQKVRLSLNNIPSGDYKIEWNFNYSQSSTNNDFRARVQLDDTTNLEEYSVEVKEAGTDNLIPASGFIVTSLTSGSHTIDIDYWAEKSTSYIRRARIMVTQLSLT